MAVEKQVLVIWAATNGYVDEVPIEQVRRFEAELLQFVENSQPGLLQAIREKKALSDEITADLKQALADFKESWKDRQAGDAGAAAVSGAAATQTASAPA